VRMAWHARGQGFKSPQLHPRSAATPCLGHPRISRLGQQIGSNLCCQADPAGSDAPPGEAQHRLDGRRESFALGLRAVKLLALALPRQQLVHDCEGSLASGPFEPHATKTPSQAKYGECSNDKDRRILRAKHPCLQHTPR